MRLSHSPPLSQRHGLVQLRWHLLHHHPPDL
jgi:hypothetical protein